MLHKTIKKKTKHNYELTIMFLLLCSEFIITKI